MQLTEWRNRTQNLGQCKGQSSLKFVAIACNFHQNGAMGDQIANIPTRLVCLSRVTFAYAGKPIFRDFTLETKQPRVVLKGPSGSGKSTLLRLLFGMLKPASGIINRPPKPYLVIQEDGLFPWLSGYENIRLFTEVADQIEAHALYTLVHEILPRPVHELSFGQRRMIELFRAIIIEPPLLLLDEPFNFLDDLRTKAIIDALLQLSNQGSQLIITTHRHDHSLDAMSEVFGFKGSPPYASLEAIV